MSIGSKHSQETKDKIANSVRKTKSKLNLGGT